MFRAVMPRLVAVGQCSRAHGACFSRGFRSRGLPINRPGLFSVWHDPHHHHVSWPAQFVDKQFKQMQQMMDDMMNPRLFGPWPWAPRWTGYTVNRDPSDKPVQVKYDQKQFEIEVDVRDFSPDELDVKVIEDKIVIHAKHREQKDEDGFTISRDIKRQFVIPQDVEPDTLECSLSQEGILTISAKVKGHQNIEERTINIKREEPTKTENDKKEE